MDRRLRLGNCPVIQANFRWNALDQDSLHTLRSGRQHHPLRDGR